MVITDNSDAVVLVLAPIGRDASAIAQVLQQVGLTAEMCADLDALAAGLERDARAALIAEEALFGKDLSGLFDWINRQPPWSDMPFLILTAHHDQPSVAVWRESLIAKLRNVSLLQRPVQTISLTSTVKAAVRARMRQYELRGLLEARERSAQILEGLVEERTRELEQANAELRRQMAERARAEETLRQAQKIEALGQLTGGVAHDFNNLLLVILAGLDVLERHTDPERRRRVTDAMRQAGQRGATLTRHLLAFSRKQQLRPETVDLSQQMRSMSELLQRSLRGDIEVRFELAEDLWPIHVDPGELELTVLNLAVNARDAMPKGGTITIRAHNVANHDAGAIAGDFVCLIVIDSGTGMSPEVRRHVFEPFYTTKEVGHGSGLGLAQVHGFATQSGGSVRIESEEGRGTSVFIMLPRGGKVPEEAKLAPPPSTGVKSEATPAANFRGSVLLVEDDAEVGALATEMFEQLGFEVTRTASAAAALGALANGRKVDLVFSDVMMPGGMNGVELARELRARRSDIPVLLTSGYAEAAKLGTNQEGLRVLPKPYGIKELASALHGIIPG